MANGVMIGQSRITEPDILVIEVCQTSGLVPPAFTKGEKTDE